MTSHITLVGEDFTQLSGYAFTYAIDNASPDTEVHIVAVGNGFEDRLTLNIDGDPQTLSADEAAALLNERAQFRIKGLSNSNQALRNVSRVVTHIRTGIPSEEILQLALELRADLVVVGGPDIHGLKRRILGSVADAVVRNATCSVVVARPKDYSASSVPEIEPPCPACVQRRAVTRGAVMWCDRHSEPLPAQHTYHFTPADMSVARKVIGTQGRR